VKGGKGPVLVSITPVSPGIGPFSQLGCRVWRFFYCVLKETLFLEPATGDSQCFVKIPSAPLASVTGKRPSQPLCPLSEVALQLLSCCLEILKF
jgi:hypothetical protein